MLSQACAIIVPGRQEPLISMAQGELNSHNKLGCREEIESSSIPSQGIIITTIRTTP